MNGSPQGPGSEPEPEQGPEYRREPEQGPTGFPPPPAPSAGHAPPGSAGPGHPSPPTPPPPRPVGKHLLVGALLGIVASFVLPVVLWQVDLALGGTGILFGAGLLLALVLAIVLTVRPRTRLLGAGMFIGFGIVLVVGGGLCVALLATIGR